MKRNKRAKAQILDKYKEPYLIIDVIIYIENSQNLKISKYILE